MNARMDERRAQKLHEHLSKLMKDGAKGVLTYCMAIGKNPDAFTFQQVSTAVERMREHHGKPLFHAALAHIIWDALIRQLKNDKHVDLKTASKIRTYATSHAMATNAEMPEDPTAKQVAVEHNRNAQTSMDYVRYHILNEQLHPQIIPAAYEIHKDLTGRMQGAKKEGAISETAIQALKSSLIRFHSTIDELAQFNQLHAEGRLRNPVESQRRKKA